MKYTKLAILLSVTAAILAGCGDSADSGPKLWPVLLILLSLALLALAALMVLVFAMPSAISKVGDYFN